jgi:hypothetical protein
MPFQRIRYSDLNSRQQEAYNFQKVSALLADYGFITIRLSSDWRGADFIAQHLDGVTFLPVQLKGRLSFDKKYQGRGLHVCFPYNGGWFMYPHDELLKKIEPTICTTDSWCLAGNYHFPRLSKELLKTLEPYWLAA